MGPTTAEFRLEGPPIPADAVVESYQALEAISRPFEVEVDFYTKDASFDAETCVKQALLLHVVDQVGQTRFFHGVVDRAEFLKWAKDRFYFRVHLVPALAALAYREDCRIFQDQSIIDVVKTIFGEAGFTADVVWKLFNSYPPREYIVQYRESTLNFVSRLFEDEGIFYYFQHSAAGDLRPLFSGRFDTTIGAKTDAASYARIAARIGVAPAAILFCSDSPAELAAAETAGVQIAHIVKDGAETDPRWPAIADFSDIVLYPRR